MALPTTIASVSVNIQGFRRVGPWISSGGNVYVALLDSADLSIVEIHKATDPETSFAEADGADHPDLTNVVYSLSAVQNGDTVHLVTQEASTGRVAYHTFDMATDQWVIVNEEVKASITTFTADAIVDLMVRSDGDVIVLYKGTHDTVTMSEFDRVKYARRESAVWTVDVAVDNGGSAAWIGGCVVPGASDRSHFFFLDDTNDDAYQRTLTSANALETFPASFDATVQSAGNRIDIGCGTSYVSGDTTKIRVPYVDASGSSMAAADSADAPTVTGAAYSTQVAQRGTSAVTDPYILTAVALGATLYAVWVNAADGDVYYNSNPNGGGWGADTNAFVAAGRNLSANIYGRAGSYKLAYLVDDGGVVKYNELDLGPGGFKFPPKQLNQAVKRAAFY